ncbi:MAG: hypothetical protein ABI616_10410 [Pseudomonadota bacterium]
MSCIITAPRWAPYPTLPCTPEEGVAVSLMMNLNQARFGPSAEYLVDIFPAEREAKRAVDGK